MVKRIHHGVHGYHGALNYLKLRVNHELRGKFLFFSFGVAVVKDLLNVNQSGASSPEDRNADYGAKNRTDNSQQEKYRDLCSMRHRRIRIAKADRTSKNVARKRAKNGRKEENSTDNFHFSAFLKTSGNKNRAPLLAPMIQCPSINWWSFPYFHSC